MPDSEWQGPEELLSHQEVTVYYCYRPYQMVSAYWYSVDPANTNSEADDNSGTMFDITDLRHALGATEADDDALLIRQAIELGWLTELGLTIPEELC